MNIKLSQQVTATYARNHFKEVTDKAIKEGICYVIRKSKPVTVVLPVEEYLKIKTKTNEARPKKIKKITLKKLMEDDFFDEHVGCLKDDYPQMTSVDLQHNWHRYVD